MWRIPHYSYKNNTFINYIPTLPSKPAHQVHTFSGSLLYPWISPWHACIFSNCDSPSASKLCQASSLSICRKGRNAEYIITFLYSPTFKPLNFLVSILSVDKTQESNCITKCNTSTLQLQPVHKSSANLTLSWYLVYNTDVSLWVWVFVRFSRPIHNYTFSRFGRGTRADNWDWKVGYLLLEPHLRWVTKSLSSMATNNSSKAWVISLCQIRT